MEWISVKDRLPELEENVLLFDYWKSVSGEQMEDIRVGYLREFVTRKSSSGLVTICLLYTSPSPRDV